MNCEICGKEIENGIKLEDGEITHVCCKHYAQYRKYGKFIDASPETARDINDFKVEGDIATVYTRNHKDKVTGSFIIDKEDLDSVITHKWRLWDDRFFTGNYKPIQLTDFLMKDRADGYVIDHINQNPADNRKKNLRITKQCNNTKNRRLLDANTSGVAGVTFDKDRNRWAVEIKYDYQMIHLKRYEKFEDACYARYIAELILFGAYRSTTNDDTLIPTAEKCQNKTEIETYVSQKILNKVPHFANIAH